MKIGIVGLGFVGSAVKNAFDKHHQVVGFDKYKKLGSLADVMSTEVTFVCVPTPTDEGIQDLRAMHDVLSGLSTMNYRGAVVIKSTVLPGTCDRLQSVYSNLRLVHNPEFLTEAMANMDFENQAFILVSSNQGTAIDQVKAVYKHVLPEAILDWSLDFKTTETAKYIHNCFLATKVAFMNEMFNYCQDMRIDFKHSVSMASTQGRIGSSHLRVPGPDGQFGFGGSCFPKDTEALLMSKAADHLRILKTAVQSNKMQRGKRA